MALFGFSGVYPKLDGGQAERVRVPNARRLLWPLPPELDDESAVFVADILPTAMRAVQRADLGSGPVRVDPVLAVTGACPVGLLTVLVAGLRTEHVVVVDPDEARREAAAGLGAAAVTPEDAPGCIASLTGGRGPTRLSRPPAARRRCGWPWNWSPAGARSAWSARTSTRRPRSTWAGCSRTDHPALLDRRAHRRPRAGGEPDPRRLRRPAADHLAPAGAGAGARGLRRLPVARRHEGRPRAMTRPLSVAVLVKQVPRPRTPARPRRQAACATT